MSMKPVKDGESPRLKFFYKSYEFPDEVKNPVVLYTHNIHVNFMLPEPIDNFWGYLPAAVWTSDLLAHQINEISGFLDENEFISTGVRGFPEENYPIHRNETLIQRKETGKLGLMKLPPEITSLTHNGMLIVELILQTCEVRIKEMLH